MAEDATGGSTRRALLKASSVPVFGSIAGCTGVFEDDDDPDNIHVGVLSPLSGANAAHAEDIVNAVELAATEAEDAGTVESVNVDAVDTEEDTGPATRRATELINEGADFLFGNIVDHVGAAVSDLASREEIIYVCQMGNIDGSGEDCNPYTFVMTESVASFCEASLGYCFRHDYGESVYEINHDYLYPEHMSMWNDDVVVPNYDGEHLGSSAVPFGETDFSTELTEARDSGADILFVGATGDDLVNIVNQAREFGLLDDGMTITAPQTGTTDAAAMDPEVLSYENAIWGMSWYHEHDAPGVEDYVESYTNEYGRPPSLQTGYNYATFHTLLEATADAESTAPENVRPELVDREWEPQLWGVGEHFRECNQRSTHQSLTAKGRPEDEVDPDEANYFELVTDWDDEDRFVIPCEETDCEMDDI